MTERINILIGSDIHYAPYYGVMLTSLFINNKESQFDVYLLTDSTWTEKETKKFEKLCGQYRSRFIVRIVDENTIKEFPTSPTISLPTYYRLQAANLLPSSVTKILYLDGDMVVTSDIRPIWDTSLDNMAVAGVVDCASHWDDTYFNRIAIDRKWQYINAGVSLYNLQYWREHDLSSLLINHITNHPDMVPLMDQDAVNTLLKDKKVILPCRYNLQTWAFLKVNWAGYDSSIRQEYLSAAKSPVIIHYSGMIKPWVLRSYYGMPFYKTWIKYWNLSMWKEAVTYKPFFKYVKFGIRFLTHIRLYSNRNKQFIPESYDIQ